MLRIFWKIIVATFKLLTNMAKNNRIALEGFVKKRGQNFNEL